MIMKHLILLISILFSSLIISAQEYVKMGSKDDVVVEYKWRKKNFFKKESPYLMYIQVSNIGFDKKVVGFEILYFWDGMVMSRSGYNEYCLKPKAVLRGKNWNLVYQSNIKTLEEINDRRFSWELDSLIVQDGGDCKTGLRIKLEPKHKINILKDTDD